MEFIFSAGGDGKADVWDNYVLQLPTGWRTGEATTGITDLWDGTLRAFSIGGLQRPDMDWGKQPYKDNYRYFTDMYIDNTFARVMIGNTSSFALCTLREIQLPSVWMDNAITIKVNADAFTDNSNAFLYVVDSDGNVNANGYPITFATNQEPSDSNPPARPKRFRVK